MKATAVSRRRLGAPIALQILALMIGGLIIAQAATVLVVLILPPSPPQVYRVSEIAAALEGISLQARDARPMSRALRESPPRALAEIDRYDRRDSRALADVLGVTPDRVVVERRRPPPFAGIEERRLGLESGDPRLAPEAPGEAVLQRLRGRGLVRASGVAPRVAFEAGRPIIGAFTAALRQPSGQWVVVEPAPEPFLNEWQRRVLFWFLACMGVLAPLAYLFARRITAPLGEFACAAERIGRDPTAPLIALSGPAEIGMAAQAMNEMQVRLKRYVQDRTATIAAVSHDLRTPLARMRFKLEKAPPGLKDSLTHDVEQMEQMVRAVLEFIREGSEPRRRERIDLLSAVECVVDDAAAAGASVQLAGGEPVIVEADALGLERLFSNLVDNAAKYGREARVVVRAEGGEGVVEIADQGPGLPDSELERVFQPFYRVEPSRNRNTGGTGLGLAVARSIARAHGGEVSLSRGDPGLVAQVRLPLAHA
jgi:signal transduction histidine kinase